MSRNNRLETALLVIIALAIMLAALPRNAAAAEPEGPTVLSIRNETGTPLPATVINTTGGSISTVFLNATTQNVRWKAYVGNITGRLTLEDASGATIYDWFSSSVNGQVYATRKETTVNWNDVVCANLTHIENENRAMNQTDAEDNITSTFSATLHRTFYVGTKQISNNSCRSVHTYVNSTAQSSLFEEVLLYDGTNETNGNIVYTSLIEQNTFGYNNQTYDFQMIIPENGQPGWSSATAYYFYVELN
jgi:hypothetical protein